MATKWTGQKTTPDENGVYKELNGGNQYELDDAVALEELNAIVNNSLYASQKVDTVIDDAKEVVEEANNAVDSVVGTANEALFQVQQVLASKGYYGSNENILVNGDFQVNQLGLKHTILGAGFAVDCWRTEASANTTQIDVDDYGNITITNINPSTSVSAYLIQDLSYETTLRIMNKAVTISYCDIDGNIYSKSGVSPNTAYTSSPSLTTDWGWFRLYFNGVNYEMTIQVKTNNSITLKWVKLEIGNVATTFNPKSYEQELSDCINRTYSINSKTGNENLLLNSHFVVNQRGNTSYTSITGNEVYTVDRWRMGWGNGTMEVLSDGLKLSITSSYLNLSQRLPIEKIKKTGYYTLSFYGNENITKYFAQTWISYTYEGTTYYCSLKYNLKTDNTIIRYYYISDEDIARMSTLTFFGVGIQFKTGDNIILNSVKLEYGNVSSLNEPKDYQEDLALCQRYFQAITPTLIYGTFATGGVTSVAETSSGSGVYTTTFWFNIPLVVPMRKNPAFSFTASLTVLCHGVHMRFDSTNIINSGLGYTQNAKAITFKKDINFNAKGSFATLRSNDSDENAPAKIFLDAEL